MLRTTSYKRSYKKETLLIQKLLNRLGYNLLQDGIFGKNTNKAVYKFQTEAGITVDGIVGPQTWGYLFYEALGIRYKQFIKWYGWNRVQYYVIKLSKKSPDVLYKGKPIKLDMFNYDIKINASFFWNNTPLGYTKINDKFISWGGLPYWYQYEPDKNKIGIIPAVNFNRTYPLDLVIDGHIKNCISGEPLLVKNGKINITQTDADGYLTRRHPRTAIGYNDKEYIIIIADGRSWRSRGVKFEELAELFVEEGADMALGLDGGGSSHLQILNTTINESYDGRHIITGLGWNL